MKFEKGSKEWTAFTELWVLCQKYWNPQTDDEWEHFTKELDVLWKKNETIFTRQFYVELVESVQMRQMGLTATEYARRKEEQRKH